MEVANFAAGFLRNVGHVLRDELLVIKRGFVSDGNDGDIACAFVGGLSVDAQDDLLADGANEGGVDVGQIADGLAVDGENVFAGADVDAELGEWGTCFGLPVFTGENFVDAVGAAGGITGEFGAEEAGFDARGLDAVAAADVGVADVQLGDHLADEIRKVVARGDGGEERGVFGALGGPVDAVHVGRVKEVAHLAPALVENLRPLGGAVEADLKAGEVEFGVGLELNLGGRQVDEGVVATGAD